MHVANFLPTAVTVVVVLCGVLAIVFRAAIAAWIGNAQQALFGAIGRAVSKRSRPSTVAFVGVMWVVLGVVGFIRNLETAVTSVQPSSDDLSLQPGVGAQESELAATLMLVLGAIWMVLGVLGVAFTDTVLSFAVRRNAGVANPNSRAASVAHSRGIRPMGKGGVRIIAISSTIFGAAAIVIGAALLTR